MRLPSRRIHASPRAVLLAVFVAAIAVAGQRLTAPASAASDGVPYLHQYLGNVSDDHDCGPAAVAMVLQAFGERPGGLSNASWVASVRHSMGVPASTGTVFDDLQRSFTAFDLQTSFIPSSLPGEPEAEVGMMRDALNAGDLVIPLLHGAALGRGDAYGDHWVVLAGFTSDGSAHLLDPDDQAPRSSAWVRGGDTTISESLFARAALKAQPGAYAMVIYPPGQSKALTPGDAAHISGTNGDGAFLRSAPGVGDDKVTLLPEGTAVTVSGPIPAASGDGHDWIIVTTADGQQGYVAAEYVSP